MRAGMLMAFDSPRHQVVGLTVVAGNVGLAHTVRNALKLCEVAGVDVPVFAGCAQPLLHRARDAANVHGDDGFGDTGYPSPRRQAETGHAALAILRLSHQYAGKLLLVALGPLTNLALALRLDPSLPARIARLVVMGGAVTGHGNLTAAAEFNIACDPEAAHVVFESFAPDGAVPDGLRNEGCGLVELADWEAVLAHGFLHADFERWLQADSPRARFYEGISRRTRAWAVDRRGALARRRCPGDGAGTATGGSAGGAGAALGDRTGRLPDPRCDGGGLAAPRRAPGQCRHPGALRPAPVRGPHPPGAVRRLSRAGRELAPVPANWLKCRSCPAQTPTQQAAAMKAGIHPEYKEVVFQDVTSDFKFLTRSTLSSKETVKWSDGNEYPLIKVEVSSATHPFYTGQNKIMDTSGRVDKFRKRYAK